MNFPVTWWVAAGVLVFVVGGSSRAEQRFPGRPGDWEVTTKSDALPDLPMVQHYCLTDETWAKALTQNPICKIQELSVTSKGVHYTLDCESKTFRMTGPVDITFDGVEHMTGKSTVTTTSRGKTTQSISVTDYRWKGPACTDADINMKKKAGN